MLDINPISEDENKQESVDKQIDPQAVNAQNSPAEEKKESVQKDPLKWNQFVNDETGPQFMEEKSDNNKVILVFTLIILFIILGVSVFLYFQIGAKQEELKTLELEQQGLNLKLKEPEIAKIDAMAQRFSSGITDLTKDLTKPKKYSLMFTHLEKVVPNDIGFESYSLDKDKIKMAAKVNSIEEGAKLVKSMQDSGYFDKVSFGGIQLNEAQENTSKYYVINLNADGNDTLFSEEPVEESIQESTEVIDETN